MGRSFILEVAKTEHEATPKTFYAYTTLPICIIHCTLSRYKRGDWLDNDIELKEYELLNKVWHVFQLSKTTAKLQVAFNS